MRKRAGCWQHLGWDAVVILLDCPKAEAADGLREGADLMSGIVLWHFSDMPARQNYFRFRIYCRRGALKTSGRRRHSPRRHKGGDGIARADGRERPDAWGSERPDASRADAVNALMMCSSRAFQQMTQERHGTRETWHKRDMAQERHGAVADFAAHMGSVLISLGPISCFDGRGCKPKA